MSKSIYVLRQGDSHVCTTYYENRESAKLFARRIGPTVEAVEFIPASIRDRIKEEIRLFAAAMRADLMLGNIDSVCEGLKQLEDSLS